PVRPGSNIDRRRLLQSAAVGGAGLLIASPRGARAQDGGLSGEITIGYEGAATGVIPYIEATAKAIEDANPDARVTLQPSPGGNYATQVILQLNSGRAPDLFLLVGVAMAELAAADLIAPLDDFTGDWDGWSQYPEDLRASLTYEGSIWAIPYLMDTHFLYYNKEIFEKAGLPRDWTPADPNDILDAALQIKESDDSVIPYALYAGANGGNGTVSRGFIPLVYAFGGELRDADGKFIIDSCAIREALDFYYRAYQTDQTVPQEVMTSPQPSSSMRQAMIDGELGILYEGSWAYGGWLEEDEGWTNDNIGFVLFPGAGDVAPFAVGGTGNSWFINNRAENKELAWAFIAEFNSVANQVSINVEDPHIPARSDAAADPAFQETPFLTAMVESSDALLLTAPDRSFLQLVGIVQNATGLIATGEATPEEAASRYAEELTRVLGADNVVAQPCE
ncbi:MAG: sugar ABC transporter substrate-binding protein, partial [Thermomicrobiales bacterium]|nr:sugar ABC transporter substrate-binding protein [Thermomicrobiales bacterium]